MLDNGGQACPEVNEDSSQASSRTDHKASPLDSKETKGEEQAAYEVIDEATSEVGGCEAKGGINSRVGLVVLGRVGATADAFSLCCLP